MGVSSACTVDTATTAARRTTYARCALKVSSFSATDGWFATLYSAASTFWVTARYYADTNTFYNSAGTNWISLYDGTTPRLALTYTGTMGGKYSQNVPIQLVKISAAGTVTVLATASSNYPVGALTKIDVSVQYGTSGRVKVYVGGVLVLDYSGDVTTDSATTLSGVRFFQPAATGDSAYWSEIIAATIDTRSLALATLAPSASGNTFNWTSGAVSDVNETTLSDQTLATSATAGQIFETTINSATVPTTGAVVSVLVTARAQKGNTGGPANLNLMVRTGGTDYASGSLALPTARFDTVVNEWATNPATGAAWLPADLSAAGFNIGVKSVT